MATDAGGQRSPPQASNVPMAARPRTVPAARETRIPLATAEGNFRNESYHLAEASRVRR